MKKALSGIRILDLTRLLPGPYCSMLLADLGAEVIKIEAPPTGDTMRLREPFLSKESMQYLILNRNKKSLTLNLKTSEARDIFYKLAGEIDIVIESFRPGVVQRLGVDYDTIKQINPKVIFCSITGYGQDGPYRDIPGHDINFLGISGILSMTGQKGGPPVVPGLPIADVGAALSAAVAILAAVIACKQTGKGQYVDASMLDSIISFTTIFAADYFGTGKAPLRGEFRQSGRYPFYNIYETKEGKYLTLGCSEPHFWANLCRALGREDLTEFQFAEGQKREAIFKFLKETFLTKERDAWVTLLREADVCCAPVNDLAEALTDRQVIAREMVQEIDHPVEGSIKQLGFPCKLSETPAAITQPPPALGEHTEEILGELGYGLEQIDGFKQRGII
ncbi:MAG: CoA transferase [Deltaproteobacteria bacterium]|nr:CoA transferase [Deltaproteobacteria bacterium]